MTGWSGLQEWRGLSGLRGCVIHVCEVYKGCGGMKVFILSPFFFGSALLKWAGGWERGWKELGCLSSNLN